MGDSKVQQFAGASSGRLVESLFLKMRFQSDELIG